MENFVTLNVDSQHPMKAQDSKKFVSKNVSLLACPWVFQGDPEFQSQQLGLAYVGSYVEDCGHKIVSYVDPMLWKGQHVKKEINVNGKNIFRVGHPNSWIIKKIGGKADYLLVNVPFTDSRFVFYPLCNAIKEAYPHMTIVVGGILATTVPYQILKETKADIIVKGEGEIAAARILNGEKLSNIAGVVYRKEDGSIGENTTRSEQLSNIDDIPWITKHSFRPMDQYVNWSPRGNQINKTFSYITSRGCPFTCEFCSIPEKGQRWRSFSPDRVIAEINYMIENYGVTHLEIEDDNFTLKSKHSIPILTYLKELRQSGYPITPSFPNGIMIDRLDREHVFAMKDAGTDAVYLPVESGHLKNLIAMDKPVAEEHLDKTLEVAKWCAEAKLEVGAFFIIGYPGGRVRKKNLKKIVYDKYKESIIAEQDDSFWITGEDERSFNETLKFAKKLKDIGVAYITPLIATPYPGTALYDICETFYWLREKDHSSMITTISYQDPKEDYVNIDTPWCSHKEAFGRWREMSNLFDIRHNVIKK